MEQTGTLRKRRRRTLVKVHGLSIIPYNAALDTFTGRLLFKNDLDTNDEQPNHPFANRSESDTRLRFSSKEMANYQKTQSASYSSRSGSRSRVTRNPQFHDDQIPENIPTRDDIFDEENGSPEIMGNDDQNNNLGENINGRKYFLDKYSMQRLKQLVWIGAMVGMYPWKWNQKKCRVECWSPFFERIWWIVWVFWTIQTIGVGMFQVYAFLKFLSAGHSTYREVFMMSFGSLWYTYALLSNWNLYYHKEETRLYINSMLSFNRNHVEKYLINLDGHQDGGQIVINLCFFTNFSQLFISSSLYLRMSFQPWYLFSYIYPKPWYWLIPGLFQEIMLIGQAVGLYVLVSWITVVHSNTMQFWLREIHNNNDTGNTSDELRQPKNAVETFKSLEILNRLFNDCMAPMGIPYATIVIATALVSCGYVLIRSMNHKFIDEFPGILTYPFSIWDCAVLGFVLLSMAAQVFDLGCSFIDSWSLTKQKDFRRILMSCPTLKIYSGKFYFITVSTTVTFFQEIFNYITDAVLTFP